MFKRFMCGFTVRHVTSFVTGTVRRYSRSKQLANISCFDEAKDKSKETFLDLLRYFDDFRNPNRRNHVDFIYKALESMKDFGVEKDLEVYKSLLNCLPKGKYVAQNIFQAEFMHYPLQQQCIIDLLEQMEENGVMPDGEMELMLVNTFGSRAYPLRRYWRMMYWMPKFRNLSPWPLPNPMPTNPWQIAQLGINRLSTADLQSTVETYQTSEIEDAVDDTWIVSNQSPVQKRLLKKHPVNQPLFVEGAFQLWLRNRRLNYFILKSEKNRSEIVEEPKFDMDDYADFTVPTIIYPMESRFLQSVPTIHEQDHETIFAICATGTSSHDSLLSWIRILENQPGNEPLKQIPILFKLQSAHKHNEVERIAGENNDNDQTKLKTT